MKKCLCLILLAAMLLSACAPATVKWPGYQPGQEGYEFCHDQERDRLWEEDILFFADTFLSTHPKLTESEITVRTLVQLPDSPEYQQQYDSTDEFYDETSRTRFLEQINALIPTISELTDAQILYELLRITAALGDAHSAVDVGFRDFFPIAFDALYESGEVSFYAVRVPQGHENLLPGKLVSINGVPVETILSRLASYVPHENEFWLHHQLSDPFGGVLMTQLAALQQIGVVKAGETVAVFSVETAAGTTDVTLNALPAESYSTTQWASHPMLEAFAFSAREELYWYELLNGGKSLYIRFSTMAEDSDYPLSQFLGDVKKIVREAKEPLQIIFDFRGNRGGLVLAPETQNLIAGINPYPAHSTYILIDSGSFSAGVGMPLRLSVGIPGAQLVGSPAGQGANHFSYPVVLTLPNHKNPFSVSSQFSCNSMDAPDTALQPDITVYQTLEDYQSCTDTVLEYIRSLS